MLGCENFRNWDLILPTTEFTYNSSVHMSIDMSLFVVVHDFRPRNPIDFIPMTHHPRVSESAYAFAASHIYDLHKETNKKIQKINAYDKTYADLHRRHFEFNKSDYVMMRI